MTTRAGDLQARPVGRLVLAEWQRTALLIATLAVLPFVVFPAVTAGREVFYYHDLQYYFLPYHQLIVDYARRGYLPLWNPYAFSGIPLLGDGQTALFYPPNWLFFLLPAPVALSYVILAEFSLAGVGMFVFTRGLGLGRPPAMLAALAYMFNGYLTTRMVHLSIMSGAALLPFVFWSVDQFRQRPGIRRFAVAALVVALQGLAGHPQVPVYTAAALALYLVVHEFVAPSPGRWQRARGALLRLGAIYLVGYSLAAIQLLPWIDFARLSPRVAGASFDFLAGQSLAGTDWLLLLFPYIYGGVRTSLFHPPQPYLPDAIYIWERSAYLGILPLALAVVALLALWRRQAALAPERRAFLLALLAVLVLGVVIAGSRDTPIARLVYITPVLGKLRAYARAIVLATFALSALSALGLQQVIEATQSGHVPGWLRRRLLGVAGLLALLFAFALGLLPRLLGSLDNERQRRLVENLALGQPAAYVPLLWGITTIGLLLWWARSGVGRKTALLSLGLVTADLVLYAVAFNPTTAATDFQGVPKSVAFLQRDRSLYRTATFLAEEKLLVPVARAQMAISWGMVFGIPSINGFNSLQPRRYTDVLFGPEVEDVSYGFLAENALLQRGNRTLSMLNTKYVLVQPGVKVTPGPDYQQVFKDKDVTIYRNRQVYPRAYFVSEVHAGAWQEKAFSILVHPTFDPRTEAVVEADLDPELVARLTERSGDGELEPAEEGGRRETTRTDGQATLRELTPNHLEIRTRAAADRFLILSEMYMPGWHATIDGQPAPIYRTNYLFRGLIVPAGEHRIDMVYRPRSAMVGAALSAITALGLLLAGIGGRRWEAVALPLTERAKTAMSGRAGGFFFTSLLFLLVAAPLGRVFRSTGDVALYQGYAQRALATPMQLPREYPALSAALFVLPQLLAPQHYLLVFSLLTALALWLTLLVVDRLSGQGWWLLLYLVLGAFGTLFFRYDIVVVLLTVLAFAATTRQRWLLAQALLALGVALKLYPLILMPLVVVDEWRTTRRFPREALLGGAIGLLLTIGSMLLLAPTETMGMVRYHRDRPLEFEAVAASLAWLLGPTTAEFSFGSWNLLSPLAPVLIPLLTAATVALMLAVFGGYGWGRLSRAGAWLLALLVGLVTSKVLSTQYLQWVLPFVVLALWEADAAGRSGWLARLRWRRLWIVLCVLTSVIYPIGLERFAVPAMIAQEAPGWFMGLVTLRNALLIVACGFALRQSLIPNARIQGQQPGDQGEHEPTA